jgi:hypothetical protein
LVERKEMQDSLLSFVERGGYEHIDLQLLVNIEGISKISVKAINYSWGYQGDTVRWEQDFVIT